MKRLVEAFRELLADSARGKGDLARTASKALDSVDWTGDLNTPQPQTHPAVDLHLKTAISLCGVPGSPSQSLAQAVADSIDRIKWRPPVTDESADPERAAFSRRHTAARVIGANGFLPSTDIIAGLTVQAPETYYPPHAHTAEESYWIIGGNGEWKVDEESWFQVKAGDGVFHRSGAHHAMQTNAQPMLAVWLWTSHLSSEVKIVGPWR
jgi:mannose-6-phosphate isomerase-like protein (cupin superfamily)